MSDEKITQLTAITAPTTDDLLVIVNDPAGTPGTKKVTIANLLSTLVYPVGVIYTTTVSTNPATVLGFGTWTAFGAGRVLVGLDAGQTEFDAVEETGGEKTHTLTTAELPGSSVNIFTSSTGGSGGGVATYSGTAGGSQYQSLGGGGAHNNLQPYIVVYMWKRTA